MSGVAPSSTPAPSPRRTRDRTSTPAPAPRRAAEISIVVARGEAVILVVATGSLDVYTVRRFRRLSERHEQTPLSLVVDLARVRLIDSSGLGALVSLRNRRRPAPLGIICPDRLLRVFRISGLWSAFCLGRDLGEVQRGLAEAGDVVARGTPDARRR